MASSEGLLGLLPWLLLVAAGCGVAVDAGGGPPPSDDQLHGYFGRGSNSKNDLQEPLDTLKALDKMWELPFFRDGADPQAVQNVVTMDDLVKVDSHMNPPLQYSVPERFRQPGGDGAYLVSASSSLPSVAPSGQDGQLDDALLGSDPRRLVDWLPQSLQKWVPTLPTLSSVLPSYIPGLNLEAEVHRAPVRLPDHVIPSPSDLKSYVNQLVRDALDTLHRKQLQLAELIKCSCPRPARCEGIFQEFLHGPKPSQSPSPSAGNILSPAPTADAVPPHLSLYAGLTKPSGDGPGLGFYVDQSGPHFGHYGHRPTAASAQSQAGAASGPGASASTAASQASAASGPDSVTPSGPPPSAASAQSAALASASSGPSGQSKPAAGQASASSSSQASSSGPGASASATSSASAHHRHTPDGIDTGAAEPAPALPSTKLGIPAPAKYSTFPAGYDGPPSGHRAPAQHPPSSAGYDGPPSAD